MFKITQLFQIQKSKQTVYKACANTHETITIVNIVLSIRNIHKSND